MLLTIITLILIALELVYFRIADHFNIIDKPNQRSSHSGIILRGGGIIFLLGAWLFWLCFGFQYSWFILGLTLVGVVSFVDDIHSLPNTLRLVVQFTAMFLLFGQLGILNLNDWWMALVGLIVCGFALRAHLAARRVSGTFPTESD